MIKSNSVSRGIRNVSRIVAIFGGFLLLAVLSIVVISVSGRALISIGLGPIPGDFELVEAGTALAVFCFLPWCQFARAHVSVDIMKGIFGPKIDTSLETLFNIIMTIVMAVILWRLWAGMHDKMAYGETSFILQFPVWWGYAVCVPAAILSVIVSFWTVLERIGLVHDDQVESR